MSDNVVNLTSNSKSDTSLVSRMRISHDSYLPLLDHNYLESGVILLSDNFKSEWVSRDSLEERTSSFNSLDVVLPNVNKEVNISEVPIPPPILIEEEIQAN